MKRKVCLILCISLIVFISWFFGRYATAFVPNILNIYQNVFHKKLVTLDKFKIYFPANWNVVKKNTETNEVIASKVPKIFDKEYQPCFIVIREMPLRHKVEYKIILKHSRQINSFYCGKNAKRDFIQCVSKEKEGKILYLMEQNCTIHEIKEFLQGLKIR